MQQLTAPQSIDLTQFSLDLFAQIASINVEYLSIAVAIILSTGILLSVLLYFLNFKPMSIRLTGQEASVMKLTTDIETERKNNEKRFSELVKMQENKFIELERGQKSTVDEMQDVAKKENEKLDKEIRTQLSEGMGALDVKFTKSLTEADKKIAELRSIAEDIEMRAEWSEHYMWEAQGTVVNSFASLLDYLELSIKYNKMFLSDICLSRMLDTLNKLKGKEKDNRKLYPRLLSALEKIKGNNDLKEQVVDKVKAIFAA